MSGLQKWQRNMLASSLSALFLCTLTYPLDVAHTKMSTDMTKKESLYNKS